MESCEASLAPCFSFSGYPISCSDSCCASTWPSTAVCYTGGSPQDVPAATGPSGEGYLSAFANYDAATYPAYHHNVVTSTTVTSPASSIEVDFNMDTLIPFGESSLISCSPTTIEQLSLLPPTSQTSSVGKSSRGSRSGHAHKPYLARKTPPHYPEGSMPISNISGRGKYSSGKGLHNNNTGSPKMAALQSVLPLRSASDPQVISCLPNPAFISSIQTLSPPVRIPFLVKLPAQYSQQMEDVNRRLLKLQAEKGRLLKQLHESSLLTGPSVTTQATGKGTALVSLAPTGQPDIDQNTVEESNSLLLTIGGLRSSLESATERLLSLCSSGHSSVDTITDCFPFILGLVPMHAQLKLKESNGISLFQIECEPSTGSGKNASGALDMMLEATNEVLVCAQVVQSHSSLIEAQLLSLQRQIQLCVPAIELSTADCNIDQRSNVRSVVEGNAAVLSAMVLAWQEYYHTATDTVTNITESLIDCTH